MSLGDISRTFVRKKESAVITTLRTVGTDIRRLCKWLSKEVNLSRVVSTLCGEGINIKFARELACSRRFLRRAGFHAAHISVVTMDRTAVKKIFYWCARHLHANCAYCSLSYAGYGRHSSEAGRGRESIKFILRAELCSLTR